MTSRSNTIKPEIIDELSALLGKLCDQSLTVEETRRLEALVMSHPGYTQYYLDYLQVHGELLWDEGRLGERTQSRPAIGRRRVLKVVRRAMAKPASWAVVSLALMFGVFVFWTPKNESGPTIVENVAKPQTSAEVTSVIEKTPAANPKIDAPLVVDNQKPTVARPDVSTPVTAPPMRGPDANSIVESDGRKPLMKEEPGLPPSFLEPMVTPSTQNAVAVVDDGKPLNDEAVIAKINQLLHDEWTEQAVKPAEFASDDVWLRRVTMDLWGRIPSVKEMNGFQSAEGDGKRARFVKKLLASEAYALHFADYWTTLLVGRRPNALVHSNQLRSYLANRFHEKPYWDEVVADLISAEGNPAENGPANYLVAHLNNQAVPATAVTARLFLCKQMQCVQCHNHPFNDSRQTDFWQLNSFFKQTKIQAVTGGEELQNKMSTMTSSPNGGVRLVNLKQGGPTFYESRNDVMHVAFPSYAGVTIGEGDDVNRREELARILQNQGKNELAAAYVNRIWSYFFTYGFTNPVDDLGSHNPAVYPELFQFLSQQFAASDFDTKRLMTWICLSDLYRLSSETTGTPEADLAAGVPVFSKMYLKPMSPEQVYDSFSLMSDEYPQNRQDWDRYLKGRDEWIRQFSIASQTDENDEVNLLDGTVPQALELINGEMSQETVKAIAVSVMRDINPARLTSEQEQGLVRSICQKTLSREPTEKELTAFRRALLATRHQATGTAEKQLAMYQQTLEDIAWAYVNSNEFSVVR